jgi:hypothetical protein
MSSPFTVVIVASLIGELVIFEEHPDDLTAAELAGL